MFWTVQVMDIPKNPNFPHLIKIHMQILKIKFVPSCRISHSRAYFHKLSIIYSLSKKTCFLSIYSINLIHLFQIKSDSPKPNFASLKRHSIVTESLLWSVPSSVGIWPPNGKVLTLMVYALKWWKLRNKLGKQ